MRFILFTLTIFVFQNTVFAQQDSVFTIEDLQTVVLKNHPVAYQARLIEASALSNLLMAKGGFDPKLEGNAMQKYFDDKQYYSYLNGKLKVPTWFGVGFEAGYNVNDGTQLNPEAYTSTEGLWNLGVSLNLGNGLFIDQRRADLKQAKIMRESSALEQQMAINQLLFDAEYAYWEWSKAQEKYAIVLQSVDKAKIRFDGIRASAFLGDKPFIDTLKAKIQVQDREVKLQELEMDLKNKIANLNTFLWKDGFVPLELSENAMPLELGNDNKPIIYEGAYILDSLAIQHPDYIIANFKIETAKINYRLQREALKPDIKLKYNALTDNSIGNDFNYSPANYNWGATVAFPIFIRKERGKAKLASIKLQESEYAMQDKRRVVAMKIIKGQNEWQYSYNQVNIQALATNNYNALFNAETALFNNGESSLFMVNQRDLSLLDASIKLAEMKFQNRLGNLKFKLATQSW